MLSKLLPDYLSLISRLNIFFAWNIEFYFGNSHQHIIRLCACVIQLCWFKRKEQAVFLEATWPIISTVNNFPKSETFQVFPRPCLALPLPSNLKCWFLTCSPNAEIIVFLPFYNLAFLYLDSSVFLRLLCSCCLNLEFQHGLRQGLSRLQNQKIVCYWWRNMLAHFLCVWRNETGKLLNRF